MPAPCRSKASRTCPRLGEQPGIWCRKESIGNASPTAPHFGSSRKFTDSLALLVGFAVQCLN